jgi:hypothetical protein
VQTPDSEGRTPLQSATDRGRDDVARLIRGEPEPEFVYVEPPPVPRPVFRLPFGASIVATILVLLTAYVGYKALSSALRDHREHLALEARGIPTTGRVVDNIESKVGTTNPKTVYSPVATYRAGGREYRRYTNRFYAWGKQPAVGTIVQVVYLPEAVDVARVKTIDRDQWVFLALVGAGMLFIPLALLTTALARGHLFARNQRVTSLNA